MYKVRFVPKNTVMLAERGETILNVARKAEIFIDAPCNGLGTCGKCKVRILKGGTNVSTIKSYHFTAAELEQGYILACNSKIKGDLTVEVPDVLGSGFTSMKIEGSAGAIENGILTDVMELAKEAGLSLSSPVRKKYLEMDHPNTNDCLSDWDRIKRHLVKDSPGLEVLAEVPILKRIPYVVREKKFKVTVTYYVENDLRIRILNIEPGDTAGKLYGVAIDVGTTSVAAFLVNLTSGEIAARASAINAQLKYGADVITRIIHAKNKQGLQEMQNAIIFETINPMLKHLRQEFHLSQNDISFIVASGNTTMMHLMLGVYPDYLRREPYIPGFLTSDPIKARDLDLETGTESLLYIQPSVSSFVGGDITAGVLASGFWNEEQNVLFIDLGTNGEIVFGNKEFLLTCACSAGPAFEGGQIKCGMRAVAGAIEVVRIDAKTLEPVMETINNQQPQGICASGLIDVIAELFQNGIIDSRGRFNRNVISPRIRYDEYEIGEYVLAFKEDWSIPADITITEIDLENFIRAKGAVYSAVIVLLNRIGMDYNEIDKIYIAGGIGTNINLTNAIKIGLFPDLPVDKFKYFGNSSLLGSYLVLRSTDARQKSEEIASRMTYLELSADSSYIGEFISACFLPHTELERFPTVSVQRNSLTAKSNRV